jgi:hypothetical protein
MSEVTATVETISPSAESQQLVAENLVSPNTERAVEDLIKNAQQQTNSAQVKETNTPKETDQQKQLATVPESSAGSQALTVQQQQPQQQQVATTPTPNHQRIAAPPGDDNFENLQKAVQILGKAKQLDEMKRFDDALKLYRQGVDMLLEELIIRQGTDQSRSYLRDKCNDFMNRIDQLKLIIQIEKATAENKENQAKLNA